MKLSPFNSHPKRTIKEYLLYAFGEVFLIVLGILLAMYINNLNQDYQYRKKIDKNLNRVYTELEKNIDKTGKIIEVFRSKDSLIHRFMNDSLKKSDYKNNAFLAALIINSQTLVLEDEAYQNLIQLNTSDNKYQDSLISDLKGVYSLNKRIKVLNEKMSDFVYNLLLNEKKGIYDKFAYNGTVSDDLIDYFLTSQEYKSDVTHYSTLAIRNQLKRYQVFYSGGVGVYKKISKQYDLPDRFDMYKEQEMIDAFTGTYATNVDSITIGVRLQNDSILMTTSNQRSLHLIPYAKNRLFWDNGDLGYFVSFFPTDTSGENMRIHLLSFDGAYEKLK